MSQRRSNPAFLNGVPELVILKLLSQQPMYGYQLVQAIKRTTSKQFEFGEGCIYPILHRLEGDDALSASRESVDGRIRVVYRLTLRGKKQLGQTAASWQRVVAAINAVLQGAGDGKPAVA